VTYKNPAYPGLKGFYSSSLVCHCAILGKLGELGELGKLGKLGKLRELGKQ
jgi:hypothetical protein